MQRKGRPSWQIAIDEPEDLHLVLFVRDCCRLPAGAAGQPGPLAPAAPDLSGLLDEPAQRAAGAAWPIWWRAAVDAHRSASRPLPPGAPSAEHLHQARQRHAAVDGPQFESLSHVPALRDAARAAFDPFQQWWQPPILAETKVQRGSRGPLGLPGVKGYLIDLHHGRSTVHDVINRIEHEVGRKAKPFDLRIDILAVTQPPVIMQEEHHALVSGELVGSESDYRDWLYSTIRQMA